MSISKDERCVHNYWEVCNCRQSVGVQTVSSFRDKYALPPEHMLRIAFADWIENVNFRMDITGLSRIMPFLNDPNSAVRIFKDYGEYVDSTTSEATDVDLICFLQRIVRDYYESQHFHPHYTVDVFDIFNICDFPKVCEAFKSNHLLFNSTLPSTIAQYLNPTRPKQFTISILKELKFWKALQNGTPFKYSPQTYYLFLESEKIPMASILTNDKIVLQIGIDVKVEHQFPHLLEFVNSPAVKKLLLHAEPLVATDFLEKIKNRLFIISTMLYNLIRWSNSQLTTQDLIVNLAAGLALYLPVSVMTEALKSIFKTTVQTGSDSIYKIQILLKILIMGLFALLASKLPGKHTVDEFINRVHKIPLAFDSVKKFWSNIDPIVGEATNFVETEVLGYDSLKAEAIVDEVQKWADMVAEFSDLYKKRQIAKDKKTMLDAGRLHVDGVRLLSKCLRLHYARENADLIRSLLATTYKISEIAIRSAADHSKPRQEPLMVWFCGSTGIGKSTLTYPFICDLMKSEGPVPDDWIQKIYARAPECEYFDGDPTDWMVYDDGFQIKDSVANPSPELFELIRLGNMFPYMFHKASIEEKGNSFAAVRGIILSSNVTRIIAESIHCPEAVARRFDRAYRTHLKDEYREYYIDGNGQRAYKLDRSKVGNSPDMSIYLFQPFDPFTGVNTGARRTYAQVVNECAEILKRKTESFVDYERWLDEYRKQPMPTTATLQVGRPTQTQLRQYRTKRAQIFDKIRNLQPLTELEVFYLLELQDEGQLTSFNYIAIRNYWERLVLYCVIS